MSQARLYFTKKSRKVWTCSKCRTQIPVGSPVISFAVGFRGYEQRRCTQAECYPTPSERESSAVASVYAAQEGVDLQSCTTLDELNDAVQQVADAAREVAEEYQANEMYEVNTDLQERAEILEQTADELENWSDSLDDEPEEEAEQVDCPECEGTGKALDPMDECDICRGTGEVDDPDAASHDDWLAEARTAAETAINEMELP